MFAYKNRAKVRKKMAFAIFNKQVHVLRVNNTILINSIKNYNEQSPCWSLF